jgi:tetratricopeptide (TPR) repeat protein
VAGEVEQDEKFFFEPSAPPESDLFGSEGEDEELFDLAAELEKDDEIFPEASGFGMGSTSEEFSFESTLSAFKKGVAQTISEQDSATHFDLAIAYREMGLYDEAIQSFFTASGDPSKYSECMLLAAMIFREKGEADKSVQTVTSALAAENVREQDKPALYAELGKALKDTGENGKALWALQKTKELDPELPEIDEIMGQLEGAAPEPVSLEPSAPAGAQETAEEVTTPPVDTGPPPTRDKTSWGSAALDESSQPGNQEADTEDKTKMKRKKISYV